MYGQYTQIFNFFCNKIDKEDVAGTGLEKRQKKIYSTLIFLDLRKKMDPEFWNKNNPKNSL